MKSIHEFYFRKCKLRNCIKFFTSTCNHFNIFRGSALARRMRDREIEFQSDARDKQREMEEIEEVLRKQMAGEPIETKTKRHAPLQTNKENEVFQFLNDLNFCTNL